VQLEHIQLTSHKGIGNAQPEQLLSSESKWSATKEGVENDKVDDI